MYFAFFFYEEKHVVKVTFSPLSQPSFPSSKDSRQLSCDKGHLGWDKGAVREVGSELTGHGEDGKTKKR